METETEETSAEEDDTPVLLLGYQTKHQGVLKIGRQAHAISVSLYRNNGSVNIKDIVWGTQYLDWLAFQRMAAAYLKAGIVVDLSLTSQQFKAIWKGSFPEMSNVVGLDEASA
ncbi:MAG: hypothetical protein HY454_03325 [Parcubacteria group bacterium]|nr:hypothetical protein [Parcubacteria group bacterium]